MASKGQRKNAEDENEPDDHQEFRSDFMIIVYQGPPTPDLVSGWTN
jgi:hypothetical protein